MKNIKIHFVLCALLLLFVTCNDKDANDCFQTAGAVIKEGFIVDAFEKIIVNERIELFITESNAQKITVETGSNLLADIEIVVKNKQLEITNNNKCNLVRDFGITRVYVSASNITEIRNSSTLPVHSIGTLNYPTLALISENFLSDFLNSGDFNLKLNTTNLSIVANGPSNFNLKGFVKNININFAGSNPRFEGENLVTETATIFARSTNDILIKTTNEINGNLYSTGDVILFTKPNIMNLKAYFTGEIIHNY